MRPPSAGLLLGLLLGAFLFFFKLGSVPLFDWDEAVYAEVTREMLETGDYLTPRYNGNPFFDKPVLLYWLMAIPFKLWGPTEFAARFWSAASGVGLLAITYLFGATVASARVGLLSLLILASAIEFVVLSHAALTDMLLTFFIAATLYCFYLGYREPARAGRGWILAAYGLMGLAVLTKGPVGAVIPIGTVTIYLLATGRLREGLIHAHPILGLGLFFLVALPWYAAIIRTHGWFFAEDFFLEHNIRRFTGVIGGHAGTPFYYLGILAVGFFPWSAFLPNLFRDLVPRSVAQLRTSEPQRRWVIYLLTWVGFVFLFFSLATTKLPNYIAPLFPALSLLVALWWDRRLSEIPERSGGFGLSATILVILSVVLSAVLIAAPFFIAWARSRYVAVAPYLSGPVDFGIGPVLLSLPLTAGALAFFFVVRLRKLLAGVMILVLMMGTFSFVLLTEVVPTVSGYVQLPLKNLTRAAAQQLNPEDRLVVYGIKKPSVLFYAQRKVIQIKPEAQDQLRKELEKPGRVAVITKASLLDILSALPPHPLNFFEHRGGYVLATNF